MNRFIKTNSPWLSLFGLSLIIIVLTFLFRPKPPHYLSNANETLKLLMDRSTEVEIKDIAGKQLIDIRSSELYSHGHPAGAINIPIPQLLDKESVQLFDHLLETGMVAILYGNDELQATAPLFLLQQLGYKNLRLLKGGLNQVSEFVPSSRITTEISVMDTTLIHGRGGQTSSNVDTTFIKKVEAVIPVRKGASTGGGC